MKKKVIIISVLAAVVLIAIAAVTTVAVTAGPRAAREQLALGDRYLEELDYENAILAYTRAIEADPRNAQAYYGLGVANAANQSPENAEAAFLQSLSLDPTGVDAYLSLADLYLQNDRLEDAADLLDKAINQTDDDEIKDLYTQTQPQAPTFSLESGSYSTYQLVEILSDSGDTIYYTLDGSEPNTESQVYTDALVLSSGKTSIRAMAVNSLGYHSEIAAADYTITARPREIAFADPEMERFVRNKLQLSYREPITDEVAAQILRISIVSSNYIDNANFTEESYQIQGNTYINEGNLGTLSDLQYMPFLEEVTIAFQEDLSITGLGGHERLSAISLIHNGITSISALKDLPALTELCLGWNNISDISALSAFPELTSLGIWGNRISNLSSISGLQKLTYLDISDNQISDLSPISGLPVLDSLWMYGNRIADVSVVTQLPSIRVLMLRDNPITDYSPVQQIFPRLTRLDVNVLNLE